MRSWLPFTVLVAFAGCDLYFGDDDDPCVHGPSVKDPPLFEGYRDPNTGTCTGAGGCDDQCGPCAADGEAAVPDLGFCQSECTGLTESTCHATGGCYAAYWTTWESPNGPPVFEGCWQTPPSGPVGGSCDGLDAQECSRHHNCSLVYRYGEWDDVRRFSACIAEPATSCAGSDCAPGYHCEEKCYGSDEPGTMSTCQAACVADTTCAVTLCESGTTCVERCGYDENGTFVCAPACVPDGQDPGSCTGQVACDALPPACPSGTTPGRSDGCWTGYCIPNHRCYPADPGACSGEVNCITGEPTCPAGTMPGILDGCWTGYCIPTSSCPAQACETLTTEASCEARSDCTPVYTGTNCTCYPNGCTCETLTWNRCE